MKKLITAVMAGSVMSPAAFAAEPATSPMVLSDSQMDMVTAGTSPTVDNSGNTTNINYSPTVDSFNLNPIGKSSANSMGETINQGGNGSLKSDLSVWSPGVLFRTGIPRLNVNFIRLGDYNQTANGGSNTQTGNVAIVRR
jgi:hypothetical protein